MWSSWSSVEYGDNYQRYHCPKKIIITGYVIMLVIVNLIFVNKDGIIHDVCRSWLSSLWKQLCEDQTSTGPMLLTSDWYQSCSGTLRHVNKGNIILNFGAFWMQYVSNRQWFYLQCWITYEHHYKKLEVEYYFIFSILVVKYPNFLIGQ